MQRPQKEEWLNAATHGCGLLLSIAATVWVVGRLGQMAPQSMVIGVACVVYCLSLMGLYLVSTLSHVFMQGLWHERFRRLDQAFIYLLVLGTYTPLAVRFPFFDQETFARWLAVTAPAAWYGLLYAGAGS